MPEWKGKTRGGILGYRIFHFILVNFGLYPAYFLLFFIAAYFLVFSGRKYIYYYFRHILGYSRFKSFVKIYQNYFIFGQVLIDKSALLAGIKTRLTFDFEGEEYLRQMKKGGILISAHIGNWEIAGQLLERLETRFNIVMYDAEHEKIKQYLNDVLVRKSFRVIIVRDDMSHIIEIFNAIKNGELICLHGDRFVDKSSAMKFDFMGKPAYFPSGPFIIASKFNVPVSFVFALKESRNHYHFFATPPQYFYNTDRSRRDESIKKAIKEYITALEEKLQKYPVQWFNYYDFWGIDSDE